MYDYIALLASHGEIFLQKLRDAYESISNLREVAVSEYVMFRSKHNRNTSGLYLVA